MAKKANNENVDVIFSRQSKRKDLIALRRMCMNLQRLRKLCIFIINKELE